MQGQDTKTVIVYSKEHFCKAGEIWKRFAALWHRTWYFTDHWFQMFYLTDIFYSSLLTFLQSQQRQHSVFYVLQVCGSLKWEQTGEWFECTRITLYTFLGNALKVFVPIWAILIHIVNDGCIVTRSELLCNYYRSHIAVDTEYGSSVDFMSPAPLTCLLVIYSIYMPIKYHLVTFILNRILIFPRRCYTSNINPLAND